MLVLCFFTLISNIQFETVLGYNDAILFPVMLLILMLPLT